MHELSIAENILEVMDQYVAADGYARCTAVTVRVGLLSAVDDEALRFAFEALCEQSAHRGAELHLEHTYPTAECACGCSFEVTDLLYECPECGAITAAMRGGDELDVIRLEVE